MTKQTEQVVPGQPLGFTPEELEAENQRITKEKKRIIGELNKIKVPLNVQVLSHHGSWSIRNIAFWEAIKQRDELVIEHMEKYLTEKK